MAASMKSGRTQKSMDVFTDEESGMSEGGTTNTRGNKDLFPERDTEIRQVSSAETGAGYEASFMVVGPTAGHAGNSTYGPGGADNSQATPSWKGTWLCRPYKRERLLEEIYSANRKGSSGHAAVLNTLKNTGVMIFIIDSKISTTTADIVDSIRNVIDHLSNEERARPSFNPRQQQRCLLYRDHEGRFFNLTLAEHTTALASKWRSLLESFSGVQALAAVTVLSRSFACLSHGSDMIDQFRPLAMSVVLGLVFNEELSLSWTNVGMFVRGMPSISAYSVTSNIQSDWLKKVSLLSLALGGITTGTSQLILTLVGIVLAVSIMLANIGSRAWRFLQWRPIPYDGPFKSIVAFLSAMATGVTFPYLGHRQVEAGGKGAMESVIRIALLVAIVFVLSDYDDIEKYVGVGIETCNQDYINLAVGAWWGFSLFASLLLVLRIEPQGIWPEDEEPLLEQDHASPVGYKVPNLPEFPIDPSLANLGMSWLDIRLEFAIGCLLSIAVGGGMCLMSFTNADEELASKIAGSLS